MNDYPTHAELQAIRDFQGSPKQFVAMINGLWWHEGFQVRNGRDSFDRKAVKKLRLSTWGWSGNEDIVGTLRDTWFWLHFWTDSHRGGHYEFMVRNDWWQQSEIPLGALPTKEIEPDE